MTDIYSTPNRESNFNFQSGQRDQAEDAPDCRYHRNDSVSSRVPSVAPGPMSGRVLTKPGQVKRLWKTHPDIAEGISEIQNEEQVRSLEQLSTDQVDLTVPPPSKCYRSYDPGRQVIQKHFGSRVVEIPRHDFSKSFEYDRHTGVVMKEKWDLAACLRFTTNNELFPRSVKVIVGVISIIAGICAIGVGAFDLFNSTTMITETIASLNDGNVTREKREFITTWYDDDVQWIYWIPDASGFATGAKILQHGVAATVHGMWPPIRKRPPTPEFYSQLNQVNDYFANHPSDFWIDMASDTAGTHSQVHEWTKHGWPGNYTPADYVDLTWAGPWLDGGLNCALPTSFSLLTTRHGTSDVSELYGVKKGKFYYRWVRPNKITVRKYVNEELNFAQEVGVSRGDVPLSLNGFKHGFDLFFPGRNGQLGLRLDSSFFSGGSTLGLPKYLCEVMSGIKGWKFPFGNRYVNSSAGEELPPWKANLAVS